MDIKNHPMLSKIFFKATKSSPDLFISALNNLKDFYSYSISCIISPDSLNSGSCGRIFFLLGTISSCISIHRIIFYMYVYMFIYIFIAGLS